MAEGAGLALALALPFALWHTRVLTAPTATGLWRGVSDPPSASRIAVALLLGGLGAFLLRHRPPAVRRPLLFLLLAGAPLVPLFTGRLVPLIAFQGPTLILVAAAALAVAVVRQMTVVRNGPVTRQSPAAGSSPWQPHQAQLFVAAFVFYALLGTRVPGPAGPQGDEPHYLLMAQSLLSDGDLDLADDLAGHEYAGFFAGTLQPHTSPRSPAGRIYAVHTPGLPVLLLPAYSAGGYPAARLFLSALAALTAVLVHRLVREATGQPVVATAAWAIFAFTPPFAFYAVALYPEVPAALATAAFLLLARRDPGMRAAMGAGLLAAALPWLHPRLLPLAALGLALTLARRCTWAARTAAVLIFAASVALLLFFFHSHYGRASLSAAYGPGFSADVSPARIPWGTLGLFLDRQFGLLAVSPVFALALAGGALLLRFRPGDAMRAALLGLSTLAVGASFSMWWGGACPPARFVVPALPALALALAPALRARRAAAAALGGIGLAIVALAADAPRVLHNRSDGESALLRALAPALDLDAGLPSFVLEEKAAPLLAVSLLAVVALALWRGARPLIAGALAYVVLAAGLHAGPLVDPRRATLDVLEAWDPARIRGPMGGPPLDELRVPLDLPGAPWVLRPLDVRNSRRIDVPPGRYRLEVRGDAQAEEPAARVARIDIVAGGQDLGSGYIREGQPPPAIPLILPEGARRLAVVASGVQGIARIQGAQLAPEGLIPHSLRDAPAR